MAALKNVYEYTDLLTNKYKGWNETIKLMEKTFFDRMIDSNRITIFIDDLDDDDYFNPTLTTIIKEFMIEEGVDEITFIR